MARHGGRARAARLLVSGAVYWLAGLAALALADPYAPHQAGFAGAPWTFLAIGLAALPMDMAAGVVPGWPAILLVLSGLAGLGAAVLRPAWSWAALPGLCALGLLGALRFSGGAG